jgi:hypothetical protein
MGIKTHTNNLKTVKITVVYATGLILREMLDIYAISTYNDLCIEVDISRARIEGLEGQRKALSKLLNAPAELTGMQYSDMPSGSHNYMSLDRIYDAICKINSMIEIEKGLLKGMLHTQEHIEEKLKGLVGIEYKVVYKRELENKTICRIAEELNYSTKQIGRIIKKVSLICPINE